MSWNNETMFNGILLSLSALSLGLAFRAIFKEIKLEEEKERKMREGK